MRMKDCFSTFPPTEAIPVLLIKFKFPLCTNKPSSLFKYSFDAHTKLSFTHPPSPCSVYSIHTCLLLSQQLPLQPHASAPFSLPSGSLGEASCPPRLCAGRTSLKHFSKLWEKKLLRWCPQVQEGQLKSSADAPKIGIQLH